MSGPPNRQIWKFPVALIHDAEQTIEMPRGAQILCVQMQNGSPFVWAEIETARAPHRVPRVFYLAWTGHELGTEGESYVGTFQTMAGAMVWHLFDRGEA